VKWQRKLDLEKLAKKERIISSQESIPKFVVVVISVIIFILDDVENRVYSR
jgi:hypothetical protein